MNRRAFLARLLTGAAGLAIGAELDIERLLWVPKPIITVPAMPVDTFGFADVDWITREALLVLERNLTFTNTINRSFDRGFVGDTVTIRRAARFAA